MSRSPVLKVRAAGSAGASSIHPHLLEKDRRHYQLIKRLNNEDVYLARYTHDKAEAKFALRRTNLENEDDLGFIENEIRVTRSLKHKNLLPFLASFVYRNQLWTVTPYCAFGSASDLSKPKGLQETEIGCITHDVLCALAYLHQVIARFLSSVLITLSFLNILAKPAVCILTTVANLPQDFNACFLRLFHFISCRFPDQMSFC